MKRIKNTTDGKLPPMSKAEALKLLRTKHLAEDDILPTWEAKEALYAAFPELVSIDEDGERQVDYLRMLDAVLHEFVEAFKTGKPQGRPSSKTINVHSVVEEQIAAGKAKTIKGALYNADKEGKLKKQPSSRSTYYRDKKAKQSRDE